MMWPQLNTNPRPAALLTYRRLRKSRRPQRGLPLGLLSAWLGAATASGAFLLRILCDVYRINSQYYLFTGLTLGSLAITTGIGAGFLHGQRAKGLGGFWLGVLGMLLFGMLAHN